MTSAAAKSLVCDNEKASSNPIQMIYGWLSPIFRGKRFRVFLERIAPSSTDTILDVGGFPGLWEQYPGSVGKIDILNIHEIPYEPSTEHHHQIETIVGDGTQLEFDQGDYDLVFSNSVIEHLSTWENQQKFAAEVSRVGKNLWIQTPAREFFMEPHFVTPFIHWVPKKLRAKLLRYFTVWGWTTRPTPEESRAAVEEIRLLTFREMQNLFPDCEIYREKFFGIFTKSYSAYRKG